MRPGMGQWQLANMLVQTLVQACQHNSATLGGLVGHHRLVCTQMRLIVCAPGGGTPPVCAPGGGTPHLGVPPGGHHQCVPQGGAHQRCVPLGAQPICACPWGGAHHQCVPLGGAHQQRVPLSWPSTRPNFWLRIGLTLKVIMGPVPTTELG